MSDVQRIVIDSKSCTGHGRCYDLAPELVADDDRGYGVVVGDGLVNDQQRQAALRAINACPEHAVSLVDC